MIATTSSPQCVFLGVFKINKKNTDKLSNSFVNRFGYSPLVTTFSHPSDDQSSVEESQNTQVALVSLTSYRSRFKVLKRISTNSPSSNWIDPFGWPSVAPSTFDTTTCLIGSNDEV